jgi:hypothetical protein
VLKVDPCLAHTSCYRAAAGSAQGFATPFFKILRQLGVSLAGFEELR